MEAIISYRDDVIKFYKEHKYQKIVDCLTDEVLNKKNNSELYAMRAIANYRLNYDATKTMNLAQLAINTDPPYYMAYFVKALILANKNENRKAITNYTKAIELKPDFADSYYNRGVAWLNENENDKAIVDFNQAIEFYNKDEFDSDYVDPDIYYNRGNTWYYKKEYEKAIADYTKVIEYKLDSEIALAYYNRGGTWLTKKEYEKAIADYSLAISFNPDFLYVYYNDRGIAWKAKKEYDKAIADYTHAIEINPTYANAYYNRGLAKKEKKVDLEEVKQDFEKYLELTIDQNEIWVKYAKYYIEGLNERINDKKIAKIEDLVAQIKELLLLEEDSITHYTSLSAIKSLILDSSRFRISEGNFINDSSEGTEFYNFLSYKKTTSKLPVTIAEKFSPKPFIGSFVAKDQYDDLNMWRFYGKENGVEAKGCAITLHTKKFIENIKNGLSNEKNEEARLDDESDVNFYRVAYIVHSGPTGFYIPNSDKIIEFQRLMMKLKKIVNSYKGDYKTSLEKYLNSIAFLFKSDAYKNENEVRLVMKGIEFEKKYGKENMSHISDNPPRVYIELEPIKMIVEQVTLGPKVEKVSEWASAFHYSYKENVPSILISHLPYK